MWKMYGINVLQPNNLFKGAVMNYKSIINAVAVAVAAMAVMFVGCGSDDEGGGVGGGDLVGDWSIMKIEGNLNGDIHVTQFTDTRKAFYSFTSSQITATQFEKISSFWIESIMGGGEYHITGDSLCIVDYEEGVDESCQKYSISGNNLTLSGSSYYEYPCGDGTDRICSETFSSTVTLKKDNLATFKNSVGSNLKSQDPKLNEKTWERESSDPDCEWCSNDRIEFWDREFYDYSRIYIPSSGAHFALWYTEGSSLTLIVRKEECEEEEWGTSCTITNEVEKIVTLEYQLTNGNKTLRLRASGGDWDEWTLQEDDDYYFSQSKSKDKKGNRAVSPFWAARR
jgi:hypothetical protein